MEYDRWNQLIVDHVRATVPTGHPVYIGFDDAALAGIAASAGCGFVSVEAAREDFVTAVRDRFVDAAGAKVAPPVRPRAAPRNWKETGPHCVAFLVFLTMAAVEMHEDEEFTDRAYFPRLCGLFGVGKHPQQTRPDGLHIRQGKQPPDVELWHWWNNWLERNGWVPTASPGYSLGSKYRRYTISQVLLRRCDRERLMEAFRRIPDRDFIGPDALASWLLTCTLPRHLREGLLQSDPERAADFVQTIHDLYDAATDVGAEGPSASITARRRLGAGIFRHCDPSTDRISYCLFASRPRSTFRGDLTVVGPDRTVVPLRPLRDRVFRPLWPVDPFPDTPASWPLHGHPEIEDIILPEERIRVLTRVDPRLSGPWANWEESPDLVSQPFMIIVSAGDEPSRKALVAAKKSGLISWREEHTVAISGCGNVLELHGCQILAYDWDSNYEFESVFRRLRPRRIAGISLTGGLQAPGGRGWMADHPPTIRAYGFTEKFTLGVVRDGEQLASVALDRQVDVPLPIRDPDPGTYHLVLSDASDADGEQLARRRLLLVSWEELVPAGVWDTPESREVV